MEVSTAGGGVLRIERRSRRDSFNPTQVERITMELEFSGVTATSRYLTVYCTARQDTWIKFCSVKVPMELLQRQDVSDAMDTAIRRELIRIWSEVDLADPLF